jgi:uncharacterized protein
VWIETIRAVKKGEELGYNYEIGREKNDPENVDEIYACRCGSPKCRGTMLSPPTRAEYLQQLERERKKKKKKSAQKGGKRTRSAKKK